MDLMKRNRLINDYEHEEEPMVPIDRFFDGNDDIGSIGCNLSPHPGMDVFRNCLVGLLDRADVEAVYARIYELDPGEECWPFADAVVVAGRISANELREAVNCLQADEIGPPEELGISGPLPGRDGLPALAIWWD
jgi:hypothetical protein